MKQFNNLTILAIETSCDDTCVAILKIKNKKSKIKNFEILSNIVSSQVEVHRKWGGVYPALAKREHQRNLPIVLRTVLKKAGFEISNFQFLISKQIPKTKLKIPNIDAIAVTVGPGLEPCLWVGVNFAKKLAKDWKLPIIPVNHIEAHILVNFSAQGGPDSGWPAICLVVSGGHTQLILMQNFGKYKILGETRDDAAGECFDKVARILGLGYPGGPAIAAVATQIPNHKFQITNKFKIQNSKFKIDLPRPMINQKNYDFSFSGLKTAVLYNFKNQPSKIRKNKQYIQEICKETQQAIIDVLIKKTIKAAKDYKAKIIILGGGVSANDELRKQFIENCKLKIENCRFLLPPKKFCTDNAVMVAVTGYFRWKKMKKAEEWQDIKAVANLRIT